MVNEEGTSNKSKLIFTWTCSGFKSHLAHFLAQVQTNKKIHNPKNSSYFGKWNFITLILKNLLYFVKRKLFLHFLNRKFFSYFLKWKPALFTPSSKNKRNPPRENFLYFRKQKSQKEFLYFLKRKFFLLFGKRKSQKNYLYFRKQNFLLYETVVCKAWKPKNSYTFSKLKCFLIIMIKCFFLILKYFFLYSTTLFFSSSERFL